MTQRHRCLEYGTNTISALAFFALAASSACSGPKPPAEGFALLVQPIDTSVSLAAWMAARPHDTSVFNAPAGARTEDLCKSAETTVQIGGMRMSRYALFYIPDPPKGEEFPRDTALFAREACHLRSIWAVAVAFDTAQARAYADSLAREIATRLGPGTPGAEIDGLGTGAWRNATTWRIGDERIVLATEAPTNYKSPETGIVSRHDGRVIVAAYTPHSGFLPSTQPSPAAKLSSWTQADDALRNARVDSAMRLGMLPAVTNDLRAITAVTPLHATHLVDPPSIRTPALDSAMVRVVSGTRAAAPGLDAAHRAAALLQADITLDAYASRLARDDSSRDDALLSPLRAAGAEYEFRRGYGQVYTRSMLWDAFRADSLGPAGHLAFMELLSRTWWTRPNCAAGRNGFDRIIEHGEAALARGDKDPAIHYYLADAYRNVYALAHGAESDYANRKEFEPRSEDARRSALTHYRQALDGLKGPVRGFVWDQAMRLLIRAHTDASLYCTFG